MGNGVWGGGSAAGWGGRRWMAVLGCPSRMHVQLVTARLNGIGSFADRYLAVLRQPEQADYSQGEKTEVQSLSTCRRHQESKGNISAL